MARRIQLPDADSLFDAPGGLRPGRESSARPSERTARPAEARAATPPRRRRRSTAATPAGEGRPRRPAQRARSGTALMAQLDRLETRLPGLATETLAELREQLEAMLGGEEIDAAEVRRLVSLGE